MIVPEIPRNRPWNPPHDRLDVLPPTPFAPGFPRDPLRILRELPLGPSMIASRFPRDRPRDPPRSPPPAPVPGSSPASARPAGQRCPTLLPAPGPDPGSTSARGRPGWGGRPGPACREQPLLRAGGRGSGSVTPESLRPPHPTPPSRSWGGVGGKHYLFL